MDSDELSIQELVDRLRAGDATARALLLSHYMDPLERVLTHLMQTEGIALTCEAHDICQSTARRFLARGEQFHFSSEQEFFACLLRIGTNLVHQRAGEARRERARQVALDGGQWARIADHRPGPDRQVAAREQWQQVEAELEPDQRVMLEQRAGRHSWNQIGARFNMSAAAARKRVRRVIDRLRRKPR